MELIEKTLSEQTIYSGRVINVKLQTVELPNGGKSKREIVKHSNAVAILALDDDKNVYLVEQYRKPVESVMLEIPAGHVEKGEDPLETAIRELREETGLNTNDIRLVNKYYTSPGFTDELIYFYVAEKLTPASQKLDEDEFINVKKVPFDEFFKMVLTNEITDVKAILAAYFYKSATVH